MLVCKRVRTDYDPATDTLTVTRKVTNLLTGEWSEEIEHVSCYMQTIRLESYLKNEMVLPENYRAKGLM